MPATRLSTCLACGYMGILEPVLDLGSQPSANKLLDKPDDPHDSYPLALVSCPACGHAQLSHAVDRQELFGDGYAYASGTGEALSDYFSWFTARLAPLLDPGARVLELACNDGSLLRHLVKSGFACEGVEPDKTLALESATICKTHQGFWPDIAPEVEGNFDCILGLNVIAHVENPMKFLVTAAAKLRQGGIVILQTSQADFLHAGQFDSIYAEHLSYPCVSSMRRLAIRSGLVLRNVHEVSIHGHSRIWVLNKPGVDSLAVKYPWLEPEFSVYSPSTAVDYATPTVYWEFRHLAAAKRRQITRVAVRARGEKKKVVLLGAAAKAMTVMRWCAMACPEFGIDMVLDESPRKIGKWIPGLKTQVSPLATIRDAGDDPLVINGAWNVPGLVGRLKQEIRWPTLVYSYFPEENYSRVFPQGPSLGDS